MPTAEPKARYRVPHTAEIGAIRTASRTRSAFFWRRSSSSPGSAPTLASLAATFAIQPSPVRAGDPDGAVVSSLTSGTGPLVVSWLPVGSAATGRRTGTVSMPSDRGARAHAVVVDLIAHDELAHQPDPSSRSWRSWRWGDSNPRPWATDQGFSGRSRRCDLASRLPSAEDLSASPGAMSGLSPQAEPKPSACSRRPSSGRRRSGGDGYLTVVRRRARSYRRLC